MTLYCASVVTKLGQQEVSGVERVTVRYSAAACSPRVALMKLIEGPFRNPATIETPKVSVPCTRKVVYVHRMHRFLAGVADSNPELRPLP